MADPIVFDFKVTGDGAVLDRFTKLRGGLEGVKEGAEETDSSWGNLSERITAGVQVYQLASEKIGMLVAGLRAMGEELERQSGILNRFTGDVSEAERRTNGLYSRIDLMVAQQKLLQSGLNLTADEFATVVVAATEYAAATGGDALAAVESLGEAVRTGGEELSRWGIRVDGATSLAQKQAQALEGLDQLYGDVESGADSLGGQMVALSTELDNATTEFIQVMNASQDAEKAFEDLWDTVREVFGTNGEETFHGMIAATAGMVEGALTGLAVTVREQVAAFGMLSDAFDALMNGDWARAANLFRGSVERFARASAAGIEAGYDAALHTTGMAGAGGTGSAATVTPAGGIGGGGGGGRRKTLDELMAGASGGFQGFAGGLATGFGEDQFDDLLGSPEAQGLGGQSEKDAEQLRHEHAMEMLDEQRESEKRLAEERQRQHEEILRQLEEERQMRLQLIDTISAGGRQLLEMGGATRGQLEFWDGLSEAAKAVGAYPDFFGMAQHGLASAMHFANAAEMGFGGGGGGAAAQAGAAASQARAQGRPEPAFGSGGSGGGGGNNLAVHIHSPIDPAQTGLVTKRALSEMRLQYSARV